MNKFIESTLWYLFGLLPYFIKTKNKTIIFYGTIQSCQDLDRYFSNTEVETIQYTFNGKSNE